MIFACFFVQGVAHWISHVQMVRVKPLSEKTNIRMLFTVFSKSSSTRDIPKDLAPVFNVRPIEVCIPQSAATKCTKLSLTTVNGSREILIVNGVVGFFGNFFLGIAVWGFPRFPGQSFRIDLGKKVS